MKISKKRGDTVNSVTISNAGDNNGWYVQAMGYELSFGDTLPSSFLLPDGSTALTSPAAPEDATANYKQNVLSNDTEFVLEHVRVYDDETFAVFLKVAN